MRTIKLCGRGGCCPTVEINKDEMKIIGDDGQIVKLTEDEFERLKFIDFKDVEHGHMV